MLKIHFFFISGHCPTLVNGPHEYQSKSFFEILILSDETIRQTFLAGVGEDEPNPLLGEVNKAKTCSAKACACGRVARTPLWS